MPHGEHDLEDAFNKAFADEEGNLQIPAEYREPLVKGLIKAVEFATEQATETLAHLRVVKEMRKMAVLTAVIVAGISVPVTYILSTEGRKHNCRLITKIATVQRERIIENKASTEKFKKESVDRLGLSPQAFQELIKKGEEREAHQLAVYNEVSHETC